MKGHRRWFSEMSSPDLARCRGTPRNGRVARVRTHVGGLLGLQLVRDARRMAAATRRRCGENGTGSGGRPRRGRVTGGPQVGEKRSQSGALDHFGRSLPAALEGGKQVVQGLHRARHLEIGKLGGDPLPARQCPHEVPPP